MKSNKKGMLTLSDFMQMQRRQRNIHAYIADAMELQRTNAKRHTESSGPGRQDTKM